MKTWKEGAAERRDDRHTKSDVIRPRSRRRGGSKKWCKGKPGVEHKPECRSYTDVKHNGQSRAFPDGRDPYAGWKILVCSVCGKEIASWCPWWVNSSHVMPDWAKEKSE